MIPVRQYKALWEYIQSSVPDIDHLFLVDDETELATKIASLSDGDIILVVVIPTTDSQAIDEDNISDVDTCVIYVLQKIEQRNTGDDDLMDERATTQELLSKVRFTMNALMLDHADDDNHRIMKQLTRGKMHIDRERNYLSCNGWSLSFSIRSRVFNNQTF
jgi:hypothetical protein